MTTESCVGCGGDKHLIHHEPGTAWWECGVCGISKEQVIEPTRSHP